MTTEKQQFDDNHEPQVKDKFSRDLKAIFTPDSTVPPQFDKDIALADPGSFRPRFQEVN